MRIARWIPKGTNTHSEYVIPIAFPRQQWLHERALLLHYSILAVLIGMLFTLVVYTCKNVLRRMCVSKKHDQENEANLIYYVQAYLLPSSVS